MTRMTGKPGEVYIGTILLERNRWAPGKRPSYRVSEWLGRFAEAGFDGMELWENHAALCPAEEIDALVESPFRVAVYNSYAGFDDSGGAERSRAAALAGRLRAAGIKFNLGKDPSLRETYLRNLRAWRSALPGNVRMLCECHGGTIMEDPVRAGEVLDELGDDSCQAIVTPFSCDLEELRTWFERLGRSVTHAHVQMRGEDGRLVRLDRSPSFVKEALHVMREGGFDGTFTIEFTEGVGAEREDIEGLFRAAARDLSFLKSQLE